MSLANGKNSHHPSLRTGMKVNGTLATYVVTMTAPGLGTNPTIDLPPEMALNFISGHQARHPLRDGQEGFMVWLTDPRSRGG